MNGGDLRFHITRKTFEERAIRFWIAELGCALRYVHEQGIVHRDVKPDSEFRMFPSTGCHTHIIPRYSAGSQWSSEVRRLRRRESVC